MAFAPGLYSPKPCPCMVIVGGENDDGKVLSDCWLFDLPTTKWTHVSFTCKTRFTFNMETECKIDTEIKFSQFCVHCGEHRVD